MGKFGPRPGSYLIQVNVGDVHLAYLSDGCRSENTAFADREEVFGPA